MRNLKVLLVFLGVMSVSSSALGGNVKMIAKPTLNVDAVSVNELKSIFLGGRSSLKNGTHVEPVLETRGAVRDQFLREYLDESDEEFQLYYRTQVFTGKGSMPKTLASDAEVVAYVAKTKGAIGYVSVGTGAGGVKTLEVK